MRQVESETGVRTRLKSNRLVRSAYLIVREILTAVLSDPRLWRGRSPEVRALREIGVCRMDSFFGRELCERLRVEVEKLVTEQSELTGSDRRRFQAQDVGIINKYFTQNKTIHEIGSNYVRRKLKFQTTLAAVLECQPGNKGSGQGWHRDSYAKQVKSIVYLNDVASDGGPFEYLRGSHRLRNILAHSQILANIGDGGYNGVRYSDDEIERLKSITGAESETFPGKKGDLLIADTRGIHRGVPIARGNRVALTNYFIDF
jgi:ectoine hydroxylase-related dioxygenase (phytanoyl-CoA dioxygenase family)